MRIPTPGGVVDDSRWLSDSDTTGQSRPCPSRPRKRVAESSIADWHSGTLPGCKRRLRGRDLPVVSLALNHRLSSVTPRGVNTATHSHTISQVGVFSPAWLAVCCNRDCGCKKYNREVISRAILNQTRACSRGGLKRDAQNQPATSNQQPATSNQQPATSN